MIAQRNPACFLLAVAVLLSAGWVPGCGGSDTPARDDTPMPSVVESNNDLACALYGRLVDEAGHDGNVFFSPLSVSTALMLAYEGTGGETRDAFERVLRLPDEDRETNHAGFAEVLATLADIDDDYTLSVANGLWGDQSTPFESAFLDTLGRHYDAELASVDFRGAPDTQRRMINAWVSDRTNSRINHLLPQGAVTERTRLVLVNAVYFKAEWDWPFEDYMTRDRTFYRASARQGGEPRPVKVPTMRKSRAYLRHAVFDGYSALELAYFGGDLSMLILLPDQRGGLHELEDGLGAAMIANTVKAMKRRHVNVWLPKWEMTLDYNLTPALDELGLGDAFGGDADFTGTSPAARDEGLRLAGVYHKAFIAVDESGTEAAAATAGVEEAAEEADYTPPPTVDFRADHPFVYLIRDNRTGAILFMGRVTDPS